MANKPEESLVRLPRLRNRQVPGRVSTVAKIQSIGLNMQLVGQPVVHQNEKCRDILPECKRPRLFRRRKRRESTQWPPSG